MRLCVVPDCGQERPRKGEFCFAHYHRLPSAIKRSLRKHRHAGQEYGLVQLSQQYLATVAGAVAWLRVMVEHKPACIQGGKS